MVAGEAEDLLIICSHPPVITCGSSTKDEHLYTSSDLLAKEGIEVLKVERGGSITYHGPEQIVCYPILNLSRHRKDVDWYMRSLEEVVIKTLEEFEITGVRVQGKTGVWISDSEKIAFSGVRISRWCTFHGLSLNVEPCAHRFAAMNPCGLGAITVTSIAEVVASAHPSRSVPSRNDIAASMTRWFCHVFGYEKSVQVPLSDNLVATSLAAT